MEQLAAHADLSWMLAAFVFVLLMFPGLAFYYGGMLGSRNVLNMMTMVLITLGITSVLYVVYGYGLVSGPSVNGWGLIGNPAEYIGLLNFQTDDGSGEPKSFTTQHGSSCSPRSPWRSWPAARLAA